MTNANGSDPHRITGGRHNAYYDAKGSPDGSRLAFRSDLGVYVIVADGITDHAGAD